MVALIETVDFEKTAEVLKNLEENVGKQMVEMVESKSDDFAVPDAAVAAAAADIVGEYYFDYFAFLL